SSRRRHTSFSRDWSSDVCSSDLDVAEDAGVERLRSCAHALAAPFMNSELEYPPVAVDEHEIELVEAEQAARLGEDALAELVHSPRPVQHAPDVEQRRARSAVPMRRAHG